MTLSVAEIERRPFLFRNNNYTATTIHMAEKLLITFVVLTIVFLLTTIVFAVLYGTETSKKSTPSSNAIITGLMNTKRKTLAEIAPLKSTVMGDTVDYDRAKALLNGNNSVPTTIIVFSERCGACHGLRRTLKAAIAEGKLSDVNVVLLPHAELNDLAKMMKVTGVPHLFRVNSGKILKELVGNVPSDTLVTFLSSPL